MESNESPFFGLGLVMFVLVIIFQLILGKQTIPSGSFFILGIVLLLLMFYDFMLGLPAGSIFCLITTIFALRYFIEVLVAYPVQTILLFLLIYGSIYFKLHELIISIFTIDDPANHEKRSKP